MGPYNKKVAVMNYGGMEGAIIAISGRWIDGGTEYASPVVSFLFDNGIKCAEWQPPHGPIQTQEKSHEKTGAIHWYYGDVVKEEGNFTFNVVQEEMLNEKFVEGDFYGIFRVLKGWANN